MVYVSGIVLGGLGREVLTDTKHPAKILAGASGINTKLFQVQVLYFENINYLIKH